jgi:hypothetical protein
MKNMAATKALVAYEVGTVVDNVRVACGLAVFIISHRVILNALFITIVARA